MSEYSVFTSESVSEGHPDKMADQISDAVLDAVIVRDPHARVAVETLVKHPMYKKFAISENLTLGNRTAGYRAYEVIRYAEVLLHFAEAQARLGETAESIEALNQVKRRAKGLPFDAPDASDVTTATAQEIIDEKGWELAGEYKRWYDLVRTETLADIAARRDTAEQVTLVRIPGEAQYIIPIPFEAISASKLEQNPAGFKIQ